MALLSTNKNKILYGKPLTCPKKRSFLFLLYFLFEYLKKTYFLSFHLLNNNNELLVKHLLSNKHLLSKLTNKKN